MSCRGICGRYQAVKHGNGGRYSLGQKRCQVCAIFIKFEGVYCPCCGCKIRSRPRSSPHRAKLLIGIARH